MYEARELFDLGKHLAMAEAACGRALYDAAYRRRMGFKWGEGGVGYARQALPYCLHPVTDPTRLIVLNRNYKPLLVEKPEWVDYEAFPQWTVQCEVVVCTDVEGLSHGYLFNDGCQPWRDRKSLRAYLNRLTLLSDLHTRPDLPTRPAGARYHSWCQPTA